MNQNKFKNLIFISLIMILVLSLIVMKDQHEKTLLNLKEVEYQKEESRLAVYNEFTKNYNELQSIYDELYGKYKEHIEYVWQTFWVTGYSDNDLNQGTDSICATGFKTDSGLPIVASNCIPLYSIIEIRGLGGFIVLDTGLGYKTKEGWEDDKWIDILFDSKEEALRFGKKELLVRILEEELPTGE